MIHTYIKQLVEYGIEKGLLEPCDSVYTTSGFYGMVIDISEDSVIVEFDNNKNCRIPMQKNAIAQVEKADAE